MKINRNNYEVYFIDYLEGNLDESLVNEFIEFIQQNPDLKAEMELLNSVSLEPEDLNFEKKDKLYKEKFDVEITFNNAAIAQLEGDLTADEKTGFENYLSKHPEKQKEALPPFSGSYIFIVVGPGSRCTCAGAFWLSFLR